MKAKRLLSVLVALCMLLCMLPANVSAFVGASQKADGTSRGYFEHNGYKIWALSNKFIRLYVLDGSGKGDKNVYLATVSAKTEASGAAAYDTVFNKKVYQRPYFVINSNEVKYDEFTVERGEYNGAPSIDLEYKLPGTKSQYKIKTRYWLSKLDEGAKSGFTSGGMQTHDENDKGRTWGVRSNTEFGYVAESLNFIEYPNIGYFVEMKGFNKMGHESVASGAGLYMSTAVGNTSDGFSNSSSAVPGAMSRINTNKVLYSAQSEAITEIFAKGYTWANPFAATSSLYSEYVDGFSRYGDYMPDYFKTTFDGDVILENSIRLMGTEIPLARCSTLWGFRDLYSEDDTSFTPNDKITINESARHLGIYKVGDEYKSFPAKNNAELETNKKKYGEPVAVIRGDYKEENGRYKFTSGAAALSPTITAAWAVSRGGLSVGKDGSIQASHLSLNCPTFKFYQEKNENSPDLDMKITDEGIKIILDSANNAAVLAVDIPGTTTSVENAVIKPSGNISFVGKAEFQLFPGAGFDVEELGYGMKNGQFKMNGIRATGSIDTAEMIGLEMGSLEGEIDTFKPYYHFKMELNVFDLFESEAELELKRSRWTGSLLPNKIYFYAGSELAKIPLVPPVVVAYIKGAGGGFDGLADTVNGDFFAIPPIKLSITGKGEVLNVVEAKATYTFGPAYYKFDAEDIGFSFVRGLNLIDEFMIYEGLQGETRNRDGKDYTGLKAFGGTKIHISVPEQAKVIQAGGELDASMFAGLDSYKNPTGLYIIADITGGITGSLHFPENWWLVGGQGIASTGFSFYLGGSTVVGVNGGFENAIKTGYKNFKVYGGAMKQGDWKIAKYRVYYLFPEKKAKIQFKGFWEMFDEWKWEDHKPEGYSMNETDESGAVAVMALNFEELESSVEALNSEGIAAYGGDVSKDVILSIPEGKSLSEDGIMLMMVTPADETVDIKAFAESLTVSKGGTNLDLVMPEYNENGEITNENAMNVLITKNAMGKDCVLIGLGDSNSASDGDAWNVTSALADFGASINYSAPFDSLDISLNGYNLSGKVANADADAEYVLNTYFGTEAGKTEYVIESEEIADPENISSVIPQNGTMLPSGRYYVTASLLRKAEAEIDGEMQEILLPVDTAELGEVDYVNDMQPNAPSEVSIYPAGNEVMTAEWTEVPEAEGYKVTIYQKKADGSFADTGNGYEYSAEKIKNSEISGIAYDAQTGKFILNMALTAGGTDIETSAKTALEANKEYKIGVKAYKYFRDEDNAPIEDVRAYSEEKESNEKLLPAYSPINIKVGVKTAVKVDGRWKNIEHKVEELESGILSCAAGNGDNHWTIQTSSENEPDAKFNITKCDTNQHFDSLENGGSADVDNTGIEGSVMFRIDAFVSRDNGAYNDTATKYLIIEKDNSAPFISVDEATVYADKTTGEYKITGLTEPGAKVGIFEDYSPVTADENGRFEYSREIDLTMHDYETGENIPDPNPSGGLIHLYASDDNYNMSAPAPVVIVIKGAAQTLSGIEITTMPSKLSYAPGESFDESGMVVSAIFSDGSKTEITDYTVEPGGALAEGTTEVVISYTFGGDTKTASVPVTVTAGGGESGGGGKRGGSKSSKYTVRFETNGGSQTASQSIAKNGKVSEPLSPKKDGFEFAGWFKDKNLTEEYDFSSAVTNGFTLYAKWNEIKEDNSSNQIILVIGEKKVRIFGETKENDVAPKIVNDRTMLPTRLIAESLGAKVDWDESRQLVTVTGKNEKGEEVVILITINSDIASVNGEQKKLDSPAFIENDRTYTPIRFISENLGADVEWVETEQKVIITKR